MDSKPRRNIKTSFCDFGGNWCPPCLELDRTLHEDRSLEARLQRSDSSVVHVDVGGIFSNNERPQNYVSSSTKDSEIDDPHFIILGP